MDGLISLSHSLSHSHSHSLSHSHRHSYTLIHEGIHTGEAGAEGARPPCVEAARSAASFMDGCVAVAVAETLAVAVSVAETVAVAVAEINPSTINPPAI